MMIPPLKPVGFLKSSHAAAMDSRTNWADWKPRSPHFVLAKRCCRLCLSRSVLSAYSGSLTKEELEQAILKLAALQRQLTHSISIPYTAAHACVWL